MTTRIFLSHARADTGATESLVRCLLACVPVKDCELRCSSLSRHALPGGASLPQFIRRDLSEAEAVLCLLTPRALSSSWFLMEMGAAWGADKPLFLLLAGGLEPGDLPGPIAQVTAFRASQVEDVTRMLRELGARVGAPLCPSDEGAAAIHRFVGEQAVQATGESVPLLVARAVRMYVSGEKADRIAAQRLIEGEASSLDYDWLLTLNTCGLGKHERAIMAIALSFHDRRDSRGLGVLLLALGKAPSDGNVYGCRLLSGIRKLLIEKVPIPRGGPDSPTSSAVLATVDYFTGVSGAETAGVARQVKGLLHDCLSREAGGG